MRRQKILILGAGGLIGGYAAAEFRTQGAEVVAAGRRAGGGLDLQIDLADRSQVRAGVENARADAVVLAAALTDVEACEARPEMARRSNVDGVRFIAEALSKTGAHLVFYSSDYLFSGDSGPYDEYASPRPISEYGLQKMEAERIVAETLPMSHTIIRTTVVYGFERSKKNFAYRLLGYLEGNKEIRVPVDQIGTPTWAADIARTTREVVDQQLLGVVHCAGPDLLSRYDFALRIASVFGIDSSQVVPVPTAALQQLASRPLKAGLLSSRLRPPVFSTPRSVDEGLREFKREVKAGERHGA